MTVLEAVLATVILGMVATALSATIAVAMNSAEVSKQRLHAMEVANRVALQWLDDETSVPSEDLAYNDGTYNFRWELYTEPLAIEDPINSARTAPVDGPAAQLLKAQELIVARVYEGVPDGIGGFRHGMLLAELRRVHNPLSVLTGRNPDALSRLSKDRTRTAGISRRIMGYSSGDPGNSNRGTISKPTTGTGGSGSTRTTPGSSGENRKLP